MKDVILLHGALGSSAETKTLARMLETEGFRTFNPDFPGHGENLLAGELTIIHLAEFLKDFILSEKLDRPIIFGYSMGGYVALQFAANSGFDGNIVTLATKMRWTSELLERESQKLNADTIREKVPKFAASLESVHGPAWERLIKNTATLLSDLTAKQYLSAEKLKNIAATVYMGVGDDDQMVSIEETFEASKNITRGSFFALPSSRHLLHQTDLEILVSVIRSAANGGSANGSRRA